MHATPAGAMWNHQPWTLLGFLGAVAPDAPFHMSVTCSGIIHRLDFGPNVTDMEEHAREFPSLVLGVLR